MNLITALLATWVISKFGATIEQMVALAFLMPIVASMGGNAGMQTLAVTIRALATRELSSSNFGKVVTKEFVIGILNGIIFAIITGIVVQLWFKEINLSILIAASMILNMIAAGLFGILVPVSLKKFNIRSEEHTSELQSRTNLVCRLLLEKKKKNTNNKKNTKKKQTKNKNNV